MTLAVALFAIAISATNAARATGIGPSIFWVAVMAICCFCASVQIIEIASK